MGAETRAEGSPRVDASAAALLEVRGLSQHFRVPGSRQPKRAVEDVSLAVQRGEILGVVGESGSGKSTVARAVVGLYRPTAGSVSLDGVPLPPGEGERSRQQKRRVQMVFQNPAAALNPRRTIGEALALPLRIHRGMGGAEAQREIGRLLGLVELPAAYAGRHPLALSGGQRQRAVIARALAAGPDLLILDEPTSALDVSVQAKVIDLLIGLKAQFGLSYLFITHDISLVRTIADRVVVLYQGRVQESGATPAVIAAPHHPYTQLLISAVPVITPAEEALQPPVPIAAHAHVAPPGALAGHQRCAFAPRCPRVMARCWGELPRLYPAGSSLVRCFLHDLPAPRPAGASPIR